MPLAWYTRFLWRDILPFVVMETNGWKIMSVSAKTAYLTSTGVGHPHPGQPIPSNSVEVRTMIFSAGAGWILINASGVVWGHCLQGCVEVWSANQWPLEMPIPPLPDTPTDPGPLQCPPFQSTRELLVTGRCTTLCTQLRRWVGAVLGKAGQFQRQFRN